jgi:hypothetical protein
MATLAQRLIDLANAIGTDIKALRLADGDLTALATANKTSLVAAINEVLGLVGGGGVQINDALGDGATTVTWSANKIFDEIVAAKAAVIDQLTAGAATALDTLAEFAVAINNDPSFAATTATALGNRVRYDAAQALSAAQKTQACSNIGVGEPDSDLVATYVTAKT